MYSCCDVKCFRIVLFFKGRYIFVISSALSLLGYLCNLNSMGSKLIARQHNKIYFEVFIPNILNAYIW